VQIATDGHPPPELIGATIADGMTATMIILAMCFGLIVPKLLIDYFSDGPTQTGSLEAKERASVRSKS
jgi:hypothetical protein